jgi:uncharacterized protein (DUF305 family)
MSPTFLLTFLPRASALALAAALGFAITPICGWAQTAHPDATAAQATPLARTAMAAEQPFVAESSAAMDKMMAGMDVRPTGDLDADFAAMMIPHHQGAIDMAVAYLRYGHNEQLRRIAQEIIVDQQQEIAAMHLALGQQLPAHSAAPTQVSPAPAAPHYRSSMPAVMKMKPPNQTKQEDKK